MAVKLISCVGCILMAFVCAATQCRALTKKGTQCKRQTAANSEYCWQHGGRTSAVAKPQAETAVVSSEVTTPLKKTTTAKVDESSGRSADDEHDLGRENDALRRENQKLRRELVRQKEGDPVIDMTSKKGRQGALSSSVSQEPIVDDGGWWLSSQGKRHNSKCRYYKMGKGRSCGKDDGTPCKKCGG